MKSVLSLKEFEADVFYMILFESLYPLLVNLIEQGDIPYEIHSLYPETERRELWEKMLSTTNAWHTDINLGPHTNFVTIGDVTLSQYMSILHDHVGLADDMK